MVSERGILYGLISMSEEVRKRMGDMKWVIGMGENEMRVVMKEGV